MSTKAAKIAAKAARIAKEAKAAKAAKLLAFAEAHWAKQGLNMDVEREWFDAANAAKVARMAKIARLAKINKQMPQPPYVPFTKSLSNPSMAKGSPVVRSQGTVSATRNKQMPQTNVHFTKRLSSPLVLMGSPVRTSSSPAHKVVLKAPLRK